MLEFDQFKDLVNEIKSLGYDEDTASCYAAIIGDTPCVDQTGAVVITVDGKIVDRLPLKFFAKF